MSVLRAPREVVEMLVIVHNILAPYRVPLFNELGQSLGGQLAVVLTRDTHRKRRRWSVPWQDVSFQAELLPHRRDSPWRACLRCFLRGPPNARSALPEGGCPRWLGPVGFVVVLALVPPPRCAGRRLGGERGRDWVVPGSAQLAGTPTVPGRLRRGTGER